MSWLSLGRCQAVSYSMEPGCWTWVTEENLLQAEGKREKLVLMNNSEWGVGKVLVSCFRVTEKWGKLIPQNVHVGRVPFPSACFVLLLFPCSFPALMLCTLWISCSCHLVTGQWARLRGKRPDKSRSSCQTGGKRQGSLVLGRSPRRGCAGGVGSRQPLIDQLPRKPSGQGFLAGLPVPWDLGKDVARAELFLNAAISSQFTGWHGGVTYAGGRSGRSSQH